MRNPSGVDRAIYWMPQFVAKNRPAEVNEFRRLIEAATKAGFVRGPNMVTDVETKD